MLVPMYLMIGIRDHGRKVYATFEFVLFTTIGALLMPLAIIYLVGAARTQLDHLTSELTDLCRIALSPTEARWLFAGFAIAVAIKVPMWHEVSEFGGLWKSVPMCAAMFMFVMLSSVGLPGLIGFVGWFLILLAPS